MYKIHCDVFIHACNTIWSISFPKNFLFLPPSLPWSPRSSPLLYFDHFFLKILLFACVEGALRPSSHCSLLCAIIYVGLICCISHWIQGSPFLYSPIFPSLCHLPVFSLLAFFLYSLLYFKHVVDTCRLNGALQTTLENSFSELNFYIFKRSLISRNHQKKNLFTSNIPLATETSFLLTKSLIKFSMLGLLNLLGLIYFPTHWNVVFIQHST